MAHIPRYVPGSFKGCIQGHGGNEGTRIALRYFSFNYQTLHGVYIENYFGDESVTRNKTLQTHQKLNKAVKVPERINFLNEVL